MKNYLFILVLTLSLGFGATVSAQSLPSKIVTSNEIIDLVIYPNPVSNGKIYITTKQNLSKLVEIYDVLGKKIVSNTLFGKELNISRLTPGIYILKIQEGTNSATRKLVVR
ncbi:T9SS type A sorting domain-containing protein [Gelidibacter salicanalis]|uniref:T9SS type A sorting domain-containing protein n=1 Tax=Gelidibacter salicanalis TaxID=291193 RepID=A0A5C7AJX7_9FLAO|nr:T9SS type A sorting domain-containing protein [Gelidibacter salicanalis]TXE09026.1 T9SS type A sorting domain-containing protein [Gelidibacter salicanalis]